MAKVYISNGPFIEYSDSKKRFHMGFNLFQFNFLKQKYIKHKKTTHALKNQVVLKEMSVLAFILQLAGL